MLKVFEVFSGIGSQRQALENKNIPHEIVATSDWDISAIYAYDILHNGPQDLKDFRHHTLESITKELEKYNLSADSKTPMGKNLNSLSFSHKKALLHAIIRNNNLTDITKVHASVLPPIDLITYTFPCQDLSIAGHWHNNKGGITKGSNNRSSLLWEIDRILYEYVESDMKNPRFLMMENVTNILSDKYKDDFEEWKKTLEERGYHNQVYTLDARDFGIPQSRIRTFMISVLVENEDERKVVEKYFQENNLESYTLNETEIRPLEDFLRLDYSNPVYKEEALKSTPRYTPSREKIYNNNPILAVDGKVNDQIYARTITTKQDRNPNSGIVAFNDITLRKSNTKYRNLTGRECLLLMGHSEEDIDLLMENNFKVAKNRELLSNSKLIQLAGNSIVVQVLEAVFEQIDDLNKSLNNLSVLEETRV